MKRYYFLENLNGGFNPIDKYREWLNDMNNRHETFKVNGISFRDFGIYRDTFICITYSLSGSEGTRLHKLEDSILKDDKLKLKEK